MKSVLTILFTTLAAFVVALILGRVTIPALHALKAGQSIREIGPKWHNNKAGTPTMGGIVFMLASLVCLISGLILHVKTHIMVLAFAFAFGLIGFIDDFIKVKLKHNEGLTAIQKFLLQLIVSAVYLFVLNYKGLLTCDILIPFTSIKWVIGKTTIGKILYIAFAAFAIIGTVNAVNLTDGIDGLATGVTMPVMVFFTVACILKEKFALAIFPAALFGGLAGFLCYNFHPAKVFMGDTGSLFLGGAVCGLAFALDAPLILLLVGIIYIIETISVIMQVGYFKLTHGKRIFKMTPIHHHFEMSGWSEIKIWLVFVGITCAFCILAYFAILPMDLP